MNVSSAISFIELRRLSTEIKLMNPIKYYKYNKYNIHTCNNKYSKFFLLKYFLL